jgi:hypothetical protein
MRIILCIANRVYRLGYRLLIRSNTLTSACGINGVQALDIQRGGTQSSFTQKLETNSIAATHRLPVARTVSLHESLHTQAQITDQWSLVAGSDDDVEYRFVQFRN